MKALTVEWVSKGNLETEGRWKERQQMAKQAGALISSSVPVVRLDELEKFLDCISRHLASIQAVHAAPAVLVVAETVVDAETDAEEEVPVTQDYVNTLWNTSVDAAEDIRKLLSRCRRMGMWR